MSSYPAYPDATPDTPPENWSARFKAGKGILYTGIASIMFMEFFPALSVLPLVVILIWYFTGLKNLVQAAPEMKKPFLLAGAVLLLSYMLQNALSILYPDSNYLASTLLGTLALTGIWYSAYSLLNPATRENPIGVGRAVRFWMNALPVLVTAKLTGFLLLAYNLHLESIDPLVLLVVFVIAGVVMLPWSIIRHQKRKDYGSIMLPVNVLVMYAISVSALLAVAFIALITLAVAIAMSAG